jgi:hypothetical protein
MTHRDTAVDAIRFAIEMLRGRVGFTVCLDVNNDNAGEVFA